MSWSLKRSLKLAVLSLCLAALPLPVAQAARAPAPAGQSAGPQYVVQAGDTLFDIAVRFGVTVEALLEANPGITPESLGIGAGLVIPGIAGVSGTLNTHSLEPGETLDSLALRLGLERETLIRLNGAVNAGLFYITQPVITVDEPDAGLVVATGAAYRAPDGQGLIAFAAAHNQNPWALAAANRLPHPARSVPGALWVVPGGEAPTRALPYPLRELQLGPFPAIQGRTLAVKVTAATPVTLTGRLGDWNLNFSADAPGALEQFALQGVHRLAEPDLYPLTLTGVGADGRALAFSQRVPVRAGDYLVDEPLTVNPETIDPAITEPENALILSVVAPVTPARLWLGPFALPSVGGLRSVFGSLRSYNGSPYEYFHTGVDYSGGEDRPITAPAPGVVAFTGALTVRGNATLIDHGWGVYTGYWHQSSIQVAAGQRVETGQVIGFNGATGRVTGPHLHWELWVGGIQVDPQQWTEVTFP
jgi:murein DD-endopeptidase MepM/ murein hydrolase activator NlpD